MTAEARAICLDATSVILFKKMDRLDLLGKFGLPPVVTEGVVFEVRMRARSGSGHVEGLPRVRVVKSPAKLIATDEKLGQGERETITYCAEDKEHRLFVSDDRLAQQRAIEEGVACVDSRSLLFKAWTAGLITTIEFRRGIGYLAGTSLGSQHDLKS